MFCNITWNIHYFSYLALGNAIQLAVFIDSGNSNLIQQTVFERIELETILYWKWCKCYLKQEIRKYFEFEMTFSSNFITVRSTLIMIQKGIINNESCCICPVSQFRCVVFRCEFDKKIYFLDRTVSPMLGIQRGRFLEEHFFLYI